MKRCRSSAWIRSFLLPLAAALWLGMAACTSWKQVREPVPAALSADGPEKIRVSLVDGRQVELQSPRIVSDSLEGLIRDGKYRDDVTRVRVPLSEISQLESRQVDGWKTVGLVAGLSFAALLVAAAVAVDQSDWGSGGWGSGSSGGSSGSDTQFSCPLIYSWNGEAWRLDSGTFGGAIFEPLARTDVDGLEHAATTEDGAVRLRLANELNETDYVDAVELLVVDHSPGSEVVPDGSGALHLVGPLEAPLAAIDDHGRDVLEAVRARDGRGWESSPTGRDTAEALDVRSHVELVFHRPSGAESATLVVHGNNTAWASWLMNELIAGRGREADTWYTAMSSDPAAASALGAALAREAFLGVSVETERGWMPQGLVWEAGPEIAKRQAQRLDLSDVEGSEVRVRLESVPLYWNLDQVAISWSEVPAPEPVTVRPSIARMEGGGRDVRARLTELDDDELTLETGEAAELLFEVPPIARGMERSYLVATTGWYRIHADVRDTPPLPELARIGAEPLAVSRLSVARLNETLRALNARSVSRCEEHCVEGREEGGEGR